MKTTRFNRNDALERAGIQIKQEQGKGNKIRQSDAAFGPGFQGSRAEHNQQKAEIDKVIMNEQNWSLKQN